MSSRARLPSVTSQAPASSASSLSSSSCVPPHTHTSFTCQLCRHHAFFPFRLIPPPMRATLSVTYLVPLSCSVSNARKLAQIFLQFNRATKSFQAPSLCRTAGIQSREAVNSTLFVQSRPRARLRLVKHRCKLPFGLSLHAGTVWANQRPRSTSWSF